MKAYAILPRVQNRVRSKDKAISASLRKGVAKDLIEKVFLRLLKQTTT